ncbi:AMP-binding protein [Xenorhabdus sp. SF857]|uniref:AMP-binding protein n=1 Tax=Xenorhabdus bakwenae TaxID=3026967 RepID=UPI002557D331|nr:AMP-binding protein [Xenorhabdus sp. SF857]WFQ80639.1 AMP-binding protein [Xenorhabdus sp. SF857]
MFINDPIALNVRKQVIKEYISQQLDTEYQGCPFFVLAQSMPEINTEFAITSLPLPETLNNRLFIMAAASPLHRLSLFSAAVNYLAFLHCHEPEGCLTWAVGESDITGNTRSIMGGYRVPMKWHLTETALEQPVKRLFGEELNRWKQVAALVSDLPPQTVSSMMPTLPEILVGYSETLPPFMDSESEVLAIWLQADAEKSVLHVRFDPQKIAPELIALFMERLVCLLSSMVFEPVALLASMNWIPQPEQERLRALSAPVSQRQTLQYLNVAQAITASIRDRADTVFIEVDGRTVNFTQLAHYTENLLTLPRFPHWDSLGDCILIIGAKGVETTLAAMACMRIGKSFCLQSDSMPEQQLLDVIALHCTRTVLLQNTEQTHSGQWANLFRQHGCQVVILPDYLAVAPEQSAFSTLSVTEKPLLAELLLKGESVSLDDPLFIVMTSGSEGKPKGCINTHQALLSLSTEMYLLSGSANFHPTPRRLASVSNHIFDYFVLECVQVLTRDQVLVMVPEEARLDAKKCVAFLRENRIDALFTTTVFAEDIMEQGDIPTLHQLYFGGESLRTFKKNNYQLFNVYGPSETGVLTTYSAIEHNEQKVTIGKPFGGCQCAVVFPDTLLPCPIGVAGELLIGGIGVGSGYFNRPDLTEKTFISLNNAWLSGRYYRSGDLCCWNAQGELEILGRRDRQLKVNGFRIELDAIERQVLDLPMVYEAAVIGVEDKRGHAHLAAFIVPMDGGQSTEQDIREALLSRIPVYTVPGQITLVSVLPLTRTGKLDRQALKQLLKKEATDARPAGETQKWLATCWERHLERDTEELAVNKSFFSLGGHSLRAVKMLADVQQKFGSQSVSLQAFFQHDTIEKLAALIDAQSSSDKKAAPEDFLSLLDAAPPLSPDGRGPLSTQEARLYAQYRLYPDLLINIVPLKIPLPPGIFATSDAETGKSKREAVKKALQMLVDRHDILRTRYRIDSEGIPYAETLPSLSVDLILTDDQSQWLNRQMQVFDLHEGPLLRGFVQDAETEQACLQLQIHHILTDKPSLEILQHEFAQLLADAPLAPVKLNYRRYAMAQVNARQHPVWVQAETFWKNYMEGLDFDPFSALSGRSAIEMGGQIKYTDWALPSKSEKKIKQLCQSFNITPAILFLSVWGLTVAREGRSNRFSISVANALRSELMLSTVGMFVSLSPCAFRLDQSGEHFDQFVRKLADEQWQTTEHLFFPIEETFALLNRDPRMFGSNPLQNISYNYIDIAEDFSKEFDEISDEDNVLEPAGEAITLSVVRTAQGYRLVLEFHSDVFTETQIAALIVGYQAIFQRIMHHNPTVLQVNDLIEPENGTRKALRPVQRSTPAVPIDTLLLTAFQTLGGRPAVIEGDSTISWKEFAELTAAYTQILNHSAIRRTLIIGHTGSQMQAFLAACFLTRTTYLALETGTPQERLNEVIRHAEPDWVLNLDLNSEINATTLDWHHFHSVKSRDDNPIGWILYSSGTSGRPKGICVSADIAAQYIDSLINRLALKPVTEPSSTQQSLRVVQQFSPSFDGYLEEILLVWALHGTSVIADRYSLLNERKAKAFLNRYQPDIISAAPALFSVWNRMTDLSPLPRVCISGGDFLTRGDIDQLIDRTQIWNSYGPTETCIAVSMVNCAELPSDTALSIGEPLPHVAFSVVDQYGAPLRAGQWGEMVIYGEFAQHGYLNDPELTAEKFGQDEQGAFFRTGDLAMVDKNGLFYLKGRMDNSCKVRGNFIGLGELENRARQYPGILAAGAAVAFAGTPEACLVLAVEGKAHIQSGLQQYLARHYPRSHLPSAIFPVESLPRTEIGKMDRPRIVQLFRQWFGHEQQEPDLITDETLQNLMECWRKCLGYKGTLTLNSDFFLISGSSLSAVHLAGQLEKVFEVIFSPVDVFRNATIGEQWALIKARLNGNYEAIFREKYLNENNPALPKLLLLPPALGSLVELQALANNLAGRVTVSVLTLQPAAVENLSASAFKSALLNALKLQADNLSPSRPLWLGGYSLGAEMLAALLQHEIFLSELMPHTHIEKLIFFDPNLKTSLFDGQVLYAEFMDFCLEIHHAAEKGIDMNTDTDAETLRQISPALYQEWRQYWLQHQILENKTFHTRMLAQPFPSVSIAMFFSDDANNADIDELKQQLRGQVSIHHRNGSHSEFIQRLSADDFNGVEQ